jgi:hypothetical protein
MHVILDMAIRKLVQFLSLNLFAKIVIGNETFRILG